MKIKEELDLSSIATTVAFIIAMVVWGVRIEGKVSQNTAAMAANEESRDRVGKIALQSLDIQIDQLRQRVFMLENQQRRDE